jgi:RNA polymerase sigma-70 factor (ECF subfamily)
MILVPFPAVARSTKSHRMTEELSTSAENVELVQRLFVQYEPALHSFVHGLVPDRSCAQDVLQETFLAVTKNAGDFAPGSNFLAWSSTIARYKVLEALRGRKFVGLTPEAIEAVCASEAAPPADPRVDILSRCVKQLASTAKRIVALRYEEERAPQEIAQIIGWTPKAVNVALTRARRFLRDCVAKATATVNEN